MPSRRRPGAPVSPARRASSSPADRLAADVARFAFPRLAGGKGERRAADMVAARFADAGLDVRREDFRASRTAMPRLRLFIQGIAAVGAALFASLVATAAPGAWIAGAALLAFAMAAGRWWRGIEPAFDRGLAISSANIIGRRPAPGAGGRPPLHLVFLAHLDSKSSLLPTFWTSGVAVALTLWLVGATVLAGAAELLSKPLPLAVPAAGWVLALALLVVSRNPSGDESPGAMDNAAGLAVLLELTRTLPKDAELARAELTFLATGAEELGLLGALRWIQMHEPEFPRDRTVFVNLDSVGVGRRLLAVDTRGRAPDGRPVKRILRAAARSERIPLRFLSFLSGVGVDTMPIGARGFATVSILGDVLGAPAWRIHSRRDTLEHISAPALGEAARLVRCVALDLGAASDPGVVADSGVASDPGVAADSGVSSDPGVASDPGKTRSPASPAEPEPEPRPPREAPEAQG